jgi:hypothetical protein
VIFLRNMMYKQRKFINFWGKIMPDIRPLQKPEIYLIGDSIVNGAVVAFAKSIDHSNTTFASANIEAFSPDQIYRNDPLTFDNKVRVIITGKYKPKPNYVRPRKRLSNLEFEGKPTFLSSNTPGLLVTQGLTYFTLNGADPKKQPGHLYNFKDRNDQVDPIDPDTTDIGFVLSASPTGSNLITVKARTWFEGDISPITMAVFQIGITSDEARKEVDNADFSGRLKQ